jgi:TrmH family RNA methyltransferase
MSPRSPRSSLITSLHNPRIRRLAALRERRERTQTGRTLVEGYDELALALDSGAQPVDLIFCPALFGRPDQAALLERAERAGASVVEVDERVFRKVAYREHPDGWLASFLLPVRRLEELRLGPAPLLLVAEAVEKPGNLGAMLRTADAAGVGAVVACNPRTDWGNPNVVRASKGALFAVQAAAAGTSDVLSWLRAQRSRVVVAAPGAATRYTQANLRGPVAIVVGAEREGVSAAWLDGADEAVAIPMFGRVNSLNVSIAAALLLYEAVRQRSRPSA